MANTLATRIGYDEAVRIAAIANKNNTTLKEEVIRAGLLTEDDYTQLINPREAARSRLRLSSS